MLRSGVRRLSRGVAASASSVLSDNPIVAAPWHRQFIWSSAFRRSAISSAYVHDAAHLSRPDFHSDSYFSASQPDDPRQIHTSTTERYLPPLVDVDLIAVDRAHQPLLDALQHLDSDLAWHLYRQLGKARRSLPSSVIDLIITLQCRKPVRSSPNKDVDSKAAVRQVCDRVLALCHDRTRLQAGSSSAPASSSADRAGLSTLSAAVSLRLLYLLVVEEEQIAASRASSPAKRRSNLSTLLKTLLANVQAQKGSQEWQVDTQLRGRLAATLSRSGATDAAYDQLKLVVEQSAQTDSNTFIDPRPFDQLLSALARESNASSRHDNLLPSPIDAASPPLNENDPIIRALRLTISSQVQASKANIHKCLQALDSATLWWLLPFELDGKQSVDGLSARRPDDRFSLKPKWHPWQASRDGARVSQDSLDSFAERVALVMAQRGILQPALHIIDQLQLSHQGGHSEPETHITSKTPDHDFFTVVLERLADRIGSDSNEDARTSLDMHRGLSLDLHLAMKVYTTAHSVDIDLDSRLNRAIVMSLASCLPTSVADLGPNRPRLTKIKSHMAQRNEQRGSKQALKVYLRQFAVMMLGNDPDLSKGTISYAAQATLLGLHLRTRDYTFARRLYQLIRLRDPTRELWSSDPQAGSLQSAALHPLAGPDQDTFMWLFAESLRTPTRTVFAVQLYFDWLASGKSFPTSLNAIFVQALLRDGLISVVQRVLQQLEDDRTLLTARVARGLVVSFADAGFPHLAMELVISVSRSTASTRLFQKNRTEMDGSDGSDEAWRLSSTLKLMSIALDRSSRVAPSEFGQLRREVLRLFEEFRLGLTHHLCLTMSQRAHETQTGLFSTVTLQDVRMAYNAAMRASLSALPTIDMNTAPDTGGASVDLDDIRSMCAHVGELFGELSDLGAGPDSDSWNLRLTSSLHACWAALSQVERKKRLQETIEMLEQAFGQLFEADGNLQTLQDKVVRHSDGEGQDLCPVEIHAAVVAAVIDASRSCRDLDLGLRVYELQKRHSGSDAIVEKARLKLLADVAQPRRSTPTLSGVFDSIERHTM